MLGTPFSLSPLRFRRDTKGWLNRELEWSCSNEIPAGKSGTGRRICPTLSACIESRSGWDVPVELLQLRVYSSPKNEHPFPGWALLVGQSNSSWENRDL